MVISLERGADCLPLHPKTALSVASFTVLVPAYPGCPGKQAVKRVYIAVVVVVVIISDAASYSLATRRSGRGRSYCPQHRRRTFRNEYGGDLLSLPPFLSHPFHPLFRPHFLFFHFLILAFPIQIPSLPLFFFPFPLPLPLPSLPFSHKSSKEAEGTMLAVRRMWERK